MAPSRGSQQKNKKSAKGDTPNAEKKRAKLHEKSSNDEHPLLLAAGKTSPPKLEQRLLDIFKECFVSRLSLASSSSSLLQDVKHHLYHRDFQTAFGRQDYLEVYAARWSPSRALGYLKVFYELELPLQSLGALDGTTNRTLLGGPDDEAGSGVYITAGEAIDCSTYNAEDSRDVGTEDSQPGCTVDRPMSSWSASTSSDQVDVQFRHLNITCLGGGAGAELVALAGLLDLERSEQTSTTSANALSFHVALVDIAAWDTVISALQNAVTTPRTLSAFASAAAKAANRPLISEPASFTSSFHRLDILDLSTVAELNPILAKSNLITLMFTLNELYTTSIAATQTFLLRLTSCTTPGALLIVVDSPGSYSTVGLNNNSQGGNGSQDRGSAPEKKKKYPMHWLLDHVLLKVSADEPGDGGGEDCQAVWRKLDSESSRWFRLPSGLQYPTRLEDMRVQLHLYRRV